MIVVVAVAVPEVVRGYLSRFLLQVAPGVFVGIAGARVRDHLWEKVTAYCGEGHVVMIHPAANEQGLAFRLHRQPWELADFDGVLLPLRLRREDAESATKEPDDDAAAEVSSARDSAESAARRKQRIQRLKGRSRGYRP